MPGGPLVKVEQQNLMGCFLLVAVRAWVGRAVSRMAITGVTVSSTTGARITIATTMVTAMATMEAAALALNATHPQPTIPSNLKVAALPRWIAPEVAPSTLVACDPGDVLTAGEERLPRSPALGAWADISRSWSCVMRVQSVWRWCGDFKM